MDSREVENVYTAVEIPTILHGSTRSYQNPPQMTRVCTDQASVNEDIAIEKIDIYVQ